jgi:thiol-disulfide isomerase/thioredoxin
MDEKARRRRRRLIWTIVIAAVAGGLIIIGGHAALVYFLFKERFEIALPATAPSLAAHAIGSLSELQTTDTPYFVTEDGFLTPDGAPTSLADFRGRVVVLNVWAMWCRPCRTELPTIAALDAAYGEDLAVVAVNVDRTPEEIAAAQAFLAEENAPLTFYSDPTFELPFRLPGRGAMPQTLVIDRQGRIRAWLAGEADWSSPEARALVDALLAEES